MGGEIEPAHVDRVAEPALQQVLEPDLELQIVRARLRRVRRGVERHERRVRARGIVEIRFELALLALKSFEQRPRFVSRDGAVVCLLYTSDAADERSSV